MRPLHKSPEGRGGGRRKGRGRRRGEDWEEGENKVGKIVQEEKINSKEGRERERVNSQEG